MHTERERETEYKSNVLSMHTVYTQTEKNQQHTHPLYIHQAFIFPFIHCPRSVSACLQQTQITKWSASTFWNAQGSFWVNSRMHQGCHFSGISLISGKSHVLLQENSHSFSERHNYDIIGYIKKSCQKGVFFAPDCTKLIFMVKNRVPLIFREKHFWSLTPLIHTEYSQFHAFPVPISPFATASSIHVKLMRHNQAVL